jgi:hypothetical protein
MAQLAVMVARIDKAEHYLQRLSEDLREIKAMVPALQPSRRAGLAGHETSAEEPRNGTPQAHHDGRHTAAESQRRLLAVMKLGKEPNDVTGDGNKERAAGRWRCD